MDLKDFRSISLMGGLYKILVKVLANRLKKVVGQVVLEAQNAFMVGRQILDAVLITNEAGDGFLRRKENGILCKLDIEKAYDHIDWDFLLRRKENGILCKLDIEKAYDHLDWDFLLSVTSKMGFGSK